MTKLNISAIIITLNEQEKVQQCIESVSFCKEVLIVDSGSSDNTVTIAKDLGAKIIHQAWLGYGQQKQFGVEQASCDWVLSIDADEVVSDNLHSAIESAFLSEKDNIAGFFMPRRNHFLGKALSFGEGYPDLSLRLFNKHKAAWSHDTIHEAVKPRGETKPLKGDLLHFSEDSISQYIAKQNRYTQLQAQQLFQQGKRTSTLKCFASPIFRFIKFYILRLGFLDGVAGFIHISIGCFNSMIKYAKLLELQQKHD